MLDVGIGPMSLEVINSVVKYANEKDREIMLIASRNQIECESLGGGYVGGLNSKSFVDYVRARDKKHKIKICRDHCGPHLHAAEKNMPYEEALDRTKESLRADMYSGFNLIHIDTSACPDPYKTAEELFFSLMLCSAPLEYEFGTEENVGTAVSAEKFEKDVKFITSLHPAILKPKYVVGQTGSLVMSCTQAGTFNAVVVKQLVAIAEKYGVKLKEHNVDYISRQDVELRKSLGVGAINVAPEFGVAQTQALTLIALRVGLFKEIAAFKNVVVNDNKWKKWEYGDFTEYHKFLCGGHYHFTSPEYLALADKLNNYIEVQAVVDHKIYELLDLYTT